MTWWQWYLSVGAAFYTVALVVNGSTFKNFRTYKWSEILMSVVRGLVGSFLLWPYIIYNLLRETTNLTEALLEIKALRRENSEVRALSSCALDMNEKIEELLKIRDQTARELDQRAERYLKLFREHAEAVDILNFYAETNNWNYEGGSIKSSIYVDDLEPIKVMKGFREVELFCGGRRARQFLDRADGDKV